MGVDFLLTFIMKIDRPKKIERKSSPKHTNATARAAYALKNSTIGAGVVG